VKYADELELLAKKGTMLQGVTDRLIEIGRCYGREMNVENTKLTRISREAFPLEVVIDKQLQNVGYFNCLGRMITDDARCTREIEHRIAMAKASLNKLKCGAGEGWRRSVGPIM
jgi:hypothetical protein